MTLPYLGVEFNGLAMGPGTDYNVVSLDGFRGAGDIGINDPQQPTLDGLQPSVALLGGRTMTLTLNVIPSDGTLTTLESDMEALMSALLPVDNPVSIPQLIANLSPSWSTPRLSVCRPSKVPIVTTKSLEYTVPMQLVVAQFQAADPLIYDTDLQTVSSSTWTGSGYESCSFSVTNTGNARTFPIFTLTAIGGASGPPYAEILVNGVPTTQWDTNMGTTSPWVVNSQQETITDTNGDSQLSALVTGAGWPTFKPGTSTVQVNGYPGGGASVSVQFRSAWSAA